MPEIFKPQKAPVLLKAAEELQELRADALRTFLTLTVIGYLAWHLIVTLGSPLNGETLRVFLLAPVVIFILGSTYLLFSRNQPLAAYVFVGGGLLAIAWAIVALNASSAAMLYAILTLMAAFVLDPLAGVACTVVAIGLLIVIGNVRPGLVEPTLVGQVAIFSVTGVAGTWVLMRRLSLALGWYADSYATAERRTREAEEHRAQLARAWTQLDNAYYRLERTNAALQAAWKAADLAERSRMEFATNISHELRTPLNLISGFSEMMMTSPGSYGGVDLPLPYRGDLNAIYRSAQHLLALTDDILDLARMESGYLGLLREPIDLAEAVRDATAVVRDYLDAKGIELRLAIPTTLPTVMADRLRIRQVLLNLLNNAARFTERGHIRVAVEEREHDIRVAVTDTGPGIAPALLDRVFQQFVTQGKGQSHWHTGTGLGLPISKRFVEMHGGEMGVESTVGQGTTFWFTLPRTFSDCSSPTVTSAGILSAYLRHSEPVLVLGYPDAELARLLQRHLPGFQVETVDCLADAQTRAVDRRAAAIVVDVDTPLENVAGPATVVRCPLPRSDRLINGWGVANYLVKPVSRRDLLAAIASLHCPIHRVLVVDDDSRFTRLISRMLRSAEQHYSVSIAHNGEEAIEKMRANPPDLVLLDLTMPGLDGVGVLNQMAADPTLASLKLIVISAHQEGEGALPIGTTLRIDRSEGFTLSEVTKLLSAIVSNLAPPRAYIAATEPALPRVLPG